MEIVTSWERKGIEIGRQQGIEQGRLETLRTVLLDILTARFGLPQESLYVRALTAGSLQELGF